MGHVSTDVIHDGWTGARAIGEIVPEFSVKYIVKVDDQEDGPNFILKKCKLPKPGDSYTGIGNDNYGHAICKSVNVTPLGNKAWRATANFAAPQFDETEDDVMLDEDDEPTDDPSKQGLEVSIALVQMSKPAEMGDYVKGWSKQGVFFAPFPGGPMPRSQNIRMDAITNSAMGVFDPPPEIDYSRVAVTISRNQKRFNANRLLPFNDTVNNDPIKLRFGGKAKERFKLDIKPGEAKMQTIGADRRISSEGEVYWRVSFEFHVEPGKGRDAWRAFILDRGFGHSASFDPKTGLNLYQLGEGETDLGVTPVPFVTRDGHTPNEPVLLNGAGKPLPKGTPPVFLVYQLYHETAWAPLKLNRLGWEF